MKPMAISRIFTLKKLVACAAIVIAVSISSHAQTVPAYCLSDWTQAGIHHPAPSSATVIDFSLNGGIGDGVTPNDAALQTIFSSVSGHTVVYFPAGNYFFQSAVNLPDSVILRGAGADVSVLTFDLNGSGSNLISITGSSTAITTPLTNTAAKRDSILTVSASSPFSPGDYIYLGDVDNSVVFSSWAYGSSGQVNVIDSISGNTLFLRDALRRNYVMGRTPSIKKILPAAHCGIECLKIDRLDATVSQTSAIAMTYARDCWVKAVESNNCNFAHVEISWSTDIEISGCYFHHAFAYGGGGQGYGVALQYASGNCLVTNNCFNHLRHSILFQAGANGNVSSYNYSVDPYWTSFPANSAGDIVMHGNYPYCNLIEGNISQNIVVDASHGINGPHNLFFRNRAELYGIIMSTNPPSDSMIYVGNEVPNTGFLLGNYTLSGNGHFQHGNMIRGTLTPANTGTLAEESYYLSAPTTWMNGWPGIGVAYPYNTGTIPAKTRFTSQVYTDCNAVMTLVNNTNAPQFSAAPSPFDQQITLRGFSGSCVVEVINLTGRVVFNSTVRAEEAIDLSFLTAGVYVLRATGPSIFSSTRIIKQ